MLLALLCLASLTASAVPPPMGVAPVLVPAGGFGIDGDLFANSPTANVGDWLAGTNAGTGGAVLDANGVPLNPATTFHYVDPFGGNDNVFVGGLKWMDNPNTWQWTTSKASGKTDINNALLHISSDTNGHIWTVIAADRLSTSGDSYIDFEFLQNNLVQNPNGTFTSSGPNGGRTTNDVLLSLAFTSGGSVADFFVWRWEPNGSGGFTYIDNTASLAVGRVFAALNSNTVPVPYGAFGQTTYAPNAFAEAAVDLTALLGNFDQCLSFGFKTIMVKTKTSQSSTATIGDFVSPIQYLLKIGPSANAGPDQARCTEGDSTAFPLQGTATPGLQPIVSTTWSVVSGLATIDSPSSLITTAHLASATATLRLTVAQVNGCTETDDIVLSVKPLPVCSITGPSLVCPLSSTSFAGPAGMAAYSWSITGNGVLTGPTNAQGVTVTSGSACGQNLTLTLNVLSNGCSSACSMDALVNDTTTPSLVCPPNLVLECPADTRTNATGVATWQDACGHVTLSYSDTVTNLCGGGLFIARTWTATDTCGNSTNCLQTIIVRDTTPPILSLPPNLTLQCPADTTTNSTGTATARDTCSQVTVQYSDSVSNTCGGASVISRLWTATDACGNASSGLQTITVRDTTRPTLTVPPNLTLQCPADTTTNATGAATAQDTCSKVTVTYSDSVSNTCSGAQTIRRTWTATDACGNTTNAVQLITVRDTTPPTLTCPPNLVLECPADTSTNATGVATAQDTCSQVTVRYSDAVTNTCGGTKVIARTWTATDACGNSASAVQTITVRDTTPPTLTCPPSLVLECPANTTTNATGVATALDGCGSVRVSYSDAVTNGCGGTKFIARTWTATDQCGNSTNAVQTILVQDTTPPTLTCPANLVLECPANTGTNATGVATAKDGCGSVAVSYSDAVTNGCGGAKVIARTWTATDACGNAASAVQTITVRDTTPPTLICPSNLVLGCPANTSTNATGVASAQDGCSSVSVTYSDAVTNGCGGTKVITRTWTATDACGNHTSAVQTITVQDTTPPTLTCPPNLVLECPANTSTNATGVASAQDGCGSVTLTYSDAVTNGCGGTKFIARTWTATDQCGHSTSAVQTITVRDTTPPTLTCPPNLVFECPANTGTNATGVATAVDGCGSVTISYSDAVTNGCPGTKVIARTWRAVDQCGNVTNAVQTIAVRDTTPPTLTCPPDVVLECPVTNTGTNVTGVATAVDGCGSVTVTYSDAVTNGCGATRVIARTWTATDQCGNSTSKVQTITVRDTTPPTLTLPPNVVLECPADTSTNATGVATAQDTCSQVTVRYSDSVSNICGGAKVIARAWTATDACGNSTTAVQTITLRDTTPPTITCPPDVALECGASTAPSATGTAVAQDGCSSVTVTYSDAVTNICGGSKTITRTWTATDGCGNRASCVQTITVRDTTPPSITGVLIGTFSQGGYGGGGAPAQILMANYTTVFTNGLTLGIFNPVNGNAAPNGLHWQPNSAGLAALQAAVSQASGGSGGPLTQDAINPTTTYGGGALARQTLALTLNVGFNTAGVLGIGPNNFGSLVYTNSGSDSLNGMTVSQILAAANQALAGLGLPPGYDFNSLASLVNSLNISFDAYTVSSWGAGHLSAPGLVVSCASQVPAPNPAFVTASDTCSSPVTVTNLPDVISNYSCPNRFTITRTWVARDACGNTNTWSFQILVNDTTPPTLVCTPDRSVPAGQAWAFDAPVAADNCGAVTVQPLNTVTNLTDTNTLVATRTWLAADACGNTNTCQQTITVLLGPAPTIAADPSGLTVAYGSNATFTVTATGPGPLTYQWQLNGTNLAGATGSSFTLNAAQLTNAGLYSVVVSNAGGAVTSPAAVVNVAPLLFARLNNNLLTLTWPGAFVLQSAPNPAGPYTDLLGAISPCSINTLAKPAGFFRLRSQPVVLVPTNWSSGQFQLSCAGVPGCNFIIQASTDLSAWVNLQTNTSPFVFVDTNAWQYPRRFYRAVLAH